jgi:hypothetical protein
MSLLFYGWKNVVAAGETSTSFVKGVTVLQAVVSVTQGPTHQFKGNPTANHASHCLSPY